MIYVKEELIHIKELVSRLCKKCILSKAIGEKEGRGLNIGLKRVVEGMLWMLHMEPILGSEGEIKES